MTVKDLQKVLNKLIENGHEDYVILVSTETVFDVAKTVDVDYGGKTILIGD